MGDIRWPSNTGSRSTKDTAFIQCVDVREPQIHELWCLGLDNITRKVHPTAQVEVIIGTVGEFENKFAENGRRILVIGKLSINDSVQFWGIPDHIAGEVDCCFFATCRIPLRPQGG